MPIRATNHTNNKAANQDKLEEREAWYKLVVKIINWKDGQNQGNSLNANNKITAKEWDMYYKRMLKTNITYSKQRVLTTLEETRDKIQTHGGFESDKKVSSK